MSAVVLQVADHQLIVKSPYHPDFPGLARQLGGKWRPPHWIFDARDHDRVADLCRTIYGTAGEEVELVDVRCSPPIDDCTKTWHDFGRFLATRSYRDQGVRLGDGVVVVEGSFPPSGGSQKNPCLDAYEGTIVEIRDVPRRLVEGRTDCEIVRG